MPDKLPPLFTPLSAQEIADINGQNKALLRRLDSKDAIIREQAVRECQALPAYRIVNFMNDLGLKGVFFDTSPAVLKRRRVLGLRASLAFALNLAYFFIRQSSVLFLAGTASILITCAVLGAAEMIPQVSYSPRAWDSLARVIEGLDDPEFLPAAMKILLVQYSNISSPSTRKLLKAVHFTASRLLMTLDTETIRSFGIQRQSFHWFLLSGRWQQNPLLSIRILNILEETGTISAIPVVTAIVSEKSISTKLRPVHKAAKSCLEVLKEREKESKLPRTLLRAAEAPAPAADTLLRPATGSADDAPAQLLRATTSMVDE